MSRRAWGATVAVLLLGAVVAVAAARTLFVQVSRADLRASPSFVAAVTGAVAYGDAVRVLEGKGDWSRVEGPKGAKGWVHASALSRERVALASGGKSAGTEATSGELALAGKGFSAQVEEEFKRSHRDVDFTWVDRMEQSAVPGATVQAFLEAGGVRPPAAPAKGKK